MSIFKNNSVVSVGGVNNPNTEQFQDVWNKLYGGDIQAVEDYLTSAGFGQQVAGNPYKNLNYRQTTLQKFFSNIGFRTKYDTAMEQANLQSREYLAGLLQQAYQNDYNSPVAEAERMRQAGLNPDLQGLEGVAESAAPPEDNSVISPDTFASDNIGDIFAAAGSAFELLSGSMTSALTIAQSFQSLNAGRLANSDASMDVIMKYLNMSQNSDALGDPHVYDKFFDSLPLSRSQKKRMRPTLNAMRDSLAQKVSEMESQEKYTNSRTKVVENLGNEFKSPYWLNLEQQLESVGTQAIREFEMRSQEKLAEVNSKMADLALKRWQVQDTQTGNDLRAAQAMENYDFGVEVSANNVKNQNALVYESSLRNNGYYRDVANNMQYQQVINRVKLDWDKWFTDAKKNMLDKIERAAKNGSLFDKALLYAITASGFVADSGLGQLAGAAASALPGVAGVLGRVGSSIAERNKMNNFEVQQYSF